MRLTLIQTILFILIVPTFPAMHWVGYTQISDSARVSVLTIYPGDAIYALWGHSVLRIWDPSTGYDISYNYGTFDYRNPISFMARFAYGKLDYQLSLNRSHALLQHSWITEERGVVQQELNMSPSEIQTLYQLVSLNALPDNRVYQYNFLYDNCATRILDVLEHALQYPLADTNSFDASFRSLIRPYLNTEPELDLAINLAMGIPVDQIATTRQLGFLPVELLSLLQNAHKHSGEPLVAQTDTLFGYPSNPIPRESISLPTALGWGILIVGLWLFIRDLHRPQRRIFDMIILGIISVIGLLITFFWFISLHEITRPNMHIMWAFPMHIIAVFVTKRPWINFYWMSSMLSATIFVVGFFWWVQYTPPATLPLALTVALRSLILLRVPRTGFEPVLPA